MTLNTIPDAITANDRSRDERLGHEIAFGIQQTMACWATDFIDPPVSRYLQNRFGNKDHEVTHAHVWGGEIMGDSAALFAYLLVKRAFTKPVDAITGRVRQMLDPYLEKMGAKALSDWADQKHLTPEDAKYRRHLDAYKQFQAENIVDSTIISTSATLGNVGIQRALGNRQALAVILGSKIIGAVTTMSVMLGLRATLPTTTKSLDDELSSRYFSKVIRWTRHSLGLKDSADIERPNSPAAEAMLTPIARKELLDYLYRTYAHAHQPGDSKAIAHFIKRYGKITHAFIAALAPLSPFSGELTAAYLSCLRQNGGDKTIRNAAMLEKELENGQQEMQARYFLLHEKDFLTDLKQALQKPPEAEQPGSAMPESQRKQLAAELLEGVATMEEVEAKARAKAHHHRTLSQVLSPDSPLASTLARTLAAPMHASDAEMMPIAKDYLYFHSKLHARLASAYAPEGAINQEVKKRSPQPTQQQWQQYLERQTFQTPLAAR